MNERHDSNKNQIDSEQEHSEVFGDNHESFLRQTRCFCTLKKAKAEAINDSALQKEARAAVYGRIL